MYAEMSKITNFGDLEDQDQFTILMIMIVPITERKETVGEDCGQITMFQSEQKSKYTGLLC